VNHETFKKIKSILQKEYDKQYQKGGSPLKLSTEDKPTITLTYYREYSRYWVSFKSGIAREAKNRNKSIPYKEIIRKYSYFKCKKK
jgi:hypothetical protein